MQPHLLTVPIEKPRAVWRERVNATGFQLLGRWRSQASVILLHQPNKRFTRPRGRRTVETLRDFVACRVRIALASWIAPEGHRADREFAAPVVPLDVDGRMASAEYVPQGRLGGRPLYFKRRAVPIVFPL